MRTLLILALICLFNASATYALKDSTERISAGQLYEACKAAETGELSAKTLCNSFIAGFLSGLAYASDNSQPARNNKAFEITPFCKTEKASITKLSEGYVQLVDSIADHPESFKAQPAHTGFYSFLQIRSCE